MTNVHYLRAVDVPSHLVPSYENLAEYLASLMRALFQSANSTRREGAPSRDAYTLFLKEIMLLEHVLYSFYLGYYYDIAEYVALRVETLEYQLLEKQPYAQEMWIRGELRTAQMWHNYIIACC